jgi:hypothetical protein
MGTVEALRRGSLYAAIRNLHEDVIQKRELYISKHGRRKLAAGQAEQKSILLDDGEYIKDSSGYFLRKEHWSLDGG